MASKDRLTPESYQRQIAGLLSFKKDDEGRETAASPIRIFKDQEDEIKVIAERVGSSRPKLVREAVDFYLAHFREKEDADQETSSSSTAA